MNCAGVSSDRLGGPKRRKPLFLVTIVRVRSVHGGSLANGANESERSQRNGSRQLSGDRFRTETIYSMTVTAI
jgi:hypothetical protein